MWFRIQTSGGLLWTWTWTFCSTNFLHWLKVLLACHRSIVPWSLFLFSLGSATKTISFAFLYNIVFYLECILDLWCTQRMLWCTNIRCPRTEWKHEYWVLEYILFAHTFCARSRWLSLINLLRLYVVLVTIYCDTDKESNCTWLYMKIA